MNDTTYEELRQALLPYWQDGTLSREHVGTLAGYVRGHTDDLLAWLPIPENGAWQLQTNITRASDMKRVCAARFYPGLQTSVTYDAMGDTLPEAILRCWLVWKEKERKVAK